MEGGKIELLYKFLEEDQRAFARAGIVRIGDFKFVYDSKQKTQKSKSASKAKCDFERKSEYISKGFKQELKEFCVVEMQTENVQRYEDGNQTLTNVTDIFTQTENPMSISIGVDNDSKELKESAMDTSKKDVVEVYATAVFINSPFQCLIEEELAVIW